jgi:hypothetical protein
MSLPPSITTAAVSWGALMDWAGEGATVSVTTEMVLGGSLKSISHVPSGTTILPFASTVTASAGASATWAVPHVDQDGFIDGSGAAFKNWAYRSTAKVTLNKRTTTLVKEYQVLVGQNALDLDLVPDGSIGAPSSAPLPLVLSVNGQTGNVIVEGGTGGGVDDAGMAALIADPASDTRGALETDFATLDDLNTAVNGLATDINAVTTTANNALGVANAASTTAGTALTTAQDAETLAQDALDQIEVLAGSPAGTLTLAEGAPIPEGTPANTWIGRV